MNRIKLIQKLINAGKYKTYLEIGTQAGISFLPIRCRQKIAIDPDFQIPRSRKLVWYIRNPYNFNNRYFEETSDAFFEKRKQVLEEAAPIDVALVDGLHTYHAALQDTLNCLRYLDENGAIVLHDCFPPSAPASIPAKNYEDALEINKNADSWDLAWCGTVWKAIVYLRRAFPDQLDAFVLDTDYGLGVVRIKETLPENLSINDKLYEQVNQLEYNDLVKDRENLLNMKGIHYISELIGEIRK